MADFRIVVSKVNHSAQGLAGSKNELKRIQTALEEAYTSARRSWSCATADKFFGQLGEALKAYPTIVAFVDNAEKIMLNATGNYDKNEGEEEKQVKAILQAYK